MKSTYDADRAGKRLAALLSARTESAAARVSAPQDAAAALRKLMVEVSGLMGPGGIPKTE